MTRTGERVIDAVSGRVGITQINTVEVTLYEYVEVQFYPWFKFYFPLFWDIVIYDNEFKTKGNKI